jgi:hypothetical protein
MRCSRRVLLLLFFRHVDEAVIFVLVLVNMVTCITFIALIKLFLRVTFIVAMISTIVVVIIGGRRVNFRFHNRFSFDFGLVLFLGIRIKLYTISMPTLGSCGR